MIGRSAKCEAVLKQYGLEQSSMAVIGADRPAGSTDWRVMVTGDLQSEYLELAAAMKLVIDLERIGEARLAERVSRAVETVKRQMRPQEGQG
jgi:hypothetical protein